MVVKYYYEFPKCVSDNDGKTVLFHKFSVAPLESLVYGITKEKEFFLEWSYSIMGDDEMELEFNIITKERMIKDISFEIKKCKENEDVVKKLNFLLQRINNY